MGNNNMDSVGPEEVYSYICGTKHSGVKTVDLVRIFGTSASPLSLLSPLQDAERVYPWSNGSKEEIWFASQYGPLAKFEIEQEQVLEILTKYPRGLPLPIILLGIGIDRRNEKAQRILLKMLNSLKDHGRLNEIKGLWTIAGYGGEVDTKPRKNRRAPMVLQEPMAPNIPPKPKKGSSEIEAQVVPWQTLLSQLSDLGQVTAQVLLTEIEVVREVLYVEIMPQQGGKWFKLSLNQVLIRPRQESVSPDISGAISDFYPYAFSISPEGVVYRPFAFRLVTKSEDPRLKFTRTRVLEPDFELVGWLNTDLLEASERK